MVFKITCRQTDTSSNRTHGAIYSLKVRVVAAAASVNKNIY